MGVRRQAREAALQALYMPEHGGKSTSTHATLCFDNFLTSLAARPYAEKIISIIEENSPNIDRHITISSEQWSLARMARIDRAILRIAVAEMLYFPEVPMNVAINEAIEVAKRFAASDSPMFINGVLDCVRSYIQSQPRELKKAV